MSEPSIPDLHQVMQETERRRIEAARPDPLEEVQREIDRHAANEWTAPRQAARLEWESRRDELEAQKSAILAELG